MFVLLRVSVSVGVLCNFVSEVVGRFVFDRRTARYPGAGACASVSVRAFVGFACRFFFFS